MQFDPSIAAAEPTLIPGPKFINTTDANRTFAFQDLPVGPNGIAMNVISGPTFPRHTENPHAIADLELRGFHLCSYYGFQEQLHGDSGPATMAFVQENPMNNQITEMLASAGIDLSTCRTVRDIPFFVVRAGKPAVELWKSVVSPLQALGHWPIICGDADEFDRIEEQISDQEKDVREILAQVPAGISAAAAHAAERAAQRQRMLEHLRANPKHQEMLKFFETAGEGEGSCSNESPDYTTWSSRGKPQEVRVQSAFGYDRDPYRSVLLAIVPAASAADSPAYFNFGGFNACPSTPIHVAHLREWKQRFGAVPIAITDAVIEMFLANPVQSKEDAWSLARDFYAYCPDIVDQGTGTVNRLANEIWKSPQWYFWWD